MKTVFVKKDFGFELELHPRLDGARNAETSRQFVCAHQGKYFPKKRKKKHQAAEENEERGAWKREDK